jgi:hypothetical protein
VTEEQSKGRCHLLQHKTHFALAADKTRSLLQNQQMIHMLWWWIRYSEILIKVQFCFA